MSNLLDSTFTSGVDNNLATVDAYNGIKSNVVKSSGGGNVNNPTVIKRTANKITPKKTSTDVDVAKALHDEKVAKIKEHLSTLPEELRDYLGDPEELLEEVKVEEKFLLWEYNENLMVLDSNDQECIRAARSSLVTNSDDPDLTLNDMGEIVDRSSEIAIYSKVTCGMIESNINAPVVDVIGGLSDDVIKEKVAINSLPAAINPNKNPPIKKEVSIFDSINENSLDPDKLIPSSPVTTAVKRNVDWDWSKGANAKYKDVFRTSKSVWGESSNNIDAFNNLSNINRDKLLSINPKDPMSASSKFGFSFDTINSLLDFTNPAKVISSHPLLIEEVLRNYRLPKGGHVVESEYLSLISLMNRLKPNWDVTMRDGEVINNLTYFTYASMDAIHILSSFASSNYREAVLIAGNYKNGNIGQLLKAQYPQASIF